MEGAPNQPHSKHKHVYPVVRIDTPFDTLHPTDSVRVVKVLTSETDAETEVSRLNRINADKTCLYFYCISRLIEDRADAENLV